MDTDPVLQACPGCATLIDVSEQEPFEQVHCPVCQMMMRARTEFNNFTLVDVLGSGGMGAVYRALDRTLNRYVALKVVRREFSRDPKHLERFEREARITAAINHPHVVKVFSFGQDHGSFYIAMELVSRGSLDELISEHKRLPEARAIQIGCQIAQGLRAAHEVALIHRDIKPGNILFADANTAKIVDFGLATVFEREAGSRGEVWGTPFYVPPERLKKQPEDFRSDIWSLGATLFHAIAGRPPFDAKTVSVESLRVIKNRDVSLLEGATDVSAPTCVVIDRMLKVNPEERFESYDELIEMLSYAGSNLAARGVTVAGSEAGAALPQKPRSILRSALLALLLFGGLVATFHFKVNGTSGFLFNRSEGTSSGLEPSVKPAEAIKRKQDLLLGKYQAARKQLLSGDYASATTAFSEIQDSPFIRPLLLRWVLVHKGLAQVLAEKNQESEATFAALYDAGKFSDAPSDKPLARCFMEIGRVGSASAGMPDSFRSRGTPHASNALVWLVAGLRQWRLGNLEKAGAFLGRFEQALPAEDCKPYAEASEFKPIARKYLDDYRTSVAETKSQKVKRESAGIGLNSLGASGLKIQGTSNNLEEEKRLAVEKAEMATLSKAQVKFLAEISAYQFSSAHTFSQGLQLKTGEAEKKREVLLLLAQWLDGFKKTLIADLNKEAFPFPIRAVNGSALGEGVDAASETAVHLKTPYGSIPFAWEKLSPDSVLEMAAFFLKKEHNPAEFNDRKWKMGVYACEFGRGKQWRPILAELAASKEEYADSLEGILELSR